MVYAKDDALSAEINNGKFMRASHSGGETGKMEKGSERFNTRSNM